MRKLYKEFFFIPKREDGKMREKALMSRVAVSVYVIVMCLSAMCLTAYAWFTGSITSPTNTLSSAHYALDVTVDGREITTLENTTSDDEIYEVKIKKNGESTATTGYCVITSVNGENTVEYHTAQIGKDKNVSNTGERGELTLYIKLSPGTKVTFGAHWGTSKYYGTTDPLYVTEDTTSENPLILG